MTTCRVVEASAATTALWSVAFAPRVMAVPADDPAPLVIHRFRHAPAGAPEVDPSPVPAAISAAGRVQAADTAAQLAAWDDLRRRWPASRHVVVYDDAWFAALPPAARHTALPTEFAAEHGVIRTGGHGPVHRLASAAAGAGRVVSVLLGAASSVAAVADGQPLECSSGATGLEGVPGGVTCGDVDPAVLLYLVDRLGWSVDRVEQAVAREGGLAGVSRGRGTLAAVGADDDDARVAAEFLAHRLKRTIGGYAALLGGLDALVFSGEFDGAWLGALLRGLRYLGVGRTVTVTTTPWTPVVAAAAVGMADHG